jgi:hypothetical protein
MAKNTAAIPAKTTGSTYEAAEFEILRGFVDEPSQELSTFSGSLIKLDGTGRYPALTMSANLSITFAESGHEEGNSKIFKLITNGSYTLTFVKPSAIGLDLPLSFTNTGILASGRYLFQASFVDGQIEVTWDQRQEVSDVIFSTEIAADTGVGDFHTSASSIEATGSLSGSDIITATSIGGSVQLTGGLFGGTNRPSLDTGNGWVHFDKANSEVLGNNGSFASAIAGLDLPFSFASVIKINTLDSNFYNTFTFGDSASANGYLTNGISNINQGYFRKRQCSSAVDIETTNYALTTNFRIVTGFCTGTAITVYQDGVKIIDAEAFNNGTLSCIDQFAIGCLARNSYVLFTDMDIKEFAFLHSNVGDGRVQAWNTNLNALYSVY